MLMIFAYDFRGVLTAHRVPTGETVNKEHYKMYIRRILDYAGYQDILFFPQCSQSFLPQGH